MNSSSLELIVLLRSTNVKEEKIGSQKETGERGSGNGAKLSCECWKAGEGTPALAACIGFSEKRREQLFSCGLRKSTVAKRGYGSVWENDTTGVLIFPLLRK